MIRDSTALYCASPIMVHEWPLRISENTYSSADCPSGKEHFTEEKNHCGSPQGVGGMSPSLLWGYSSMSFASSSEKSDIELSEEEERSSWKNIHRRYPPVLKNTKQYKHKYQKIQISRTLSVSLRASSVAYFFTYSATFFLYSSGLRWKNRNTNLNDLKMPPVEVHGCSIPIQRIGWVWVGQQLNLISWNTFYINSSALWKAIQRM